MVEDPKQPDEGENADGQGGSQLGSVEVGGVAVLQPAGAQTPAVAPTPEIDEHEERDGGYADDAEHHGGEQDPQEDPHAGRVPRAGRKTRQEREKLIAIRLEVHPRPRVSYKNVIPVEP